MGTSVRVKAWRKTRRTTGEAGVTYSLWADRAPVGRVETGAGVRIEIPRERMWRISPDELPKQMMMEEHLRSWRMWAWMLPLGMVLGGLVGILFGIAGKHFGARSTVGVLFGVEVTIVAFGLARLPRSMVAEIGEEEMVVNVKQWVGRRVRRVRREEAVDVVLEWKRRWRWWKWGLRIAFLRWVDRRGKKLLLARSLDVRGMQLVLDEIVQRWKLREREDVVKAEDDGGETASDPGQCPGNFKMKVERNGDGVWESHLPGRRGARIWVAVTSMPLLAVVGMLVAAFVQSGISRWGAGTIGFILGLEFLFFTRGWIVEALGWRRIGFDGERLWARNLELLGIGDGKWNRWGIEKVEVWGRQKRRGRSGSLVVEFRNGKKRMLVTKWEEKEVIYLGELIAASIGAQVIEVRIEGINVS